MYYQRNLEKKIKNNLKNDKAVIVTGMRQTGKTSLLKKIYHEILSDNKVWFDFENPLDIKKFEDIDYNDVLENIIIEGNLDKEKRMYVFIDEVQHYSEISKIVKYLIDHYQVKFILTGSASYYLKNLFPESLAGRKIILELFPLDFKEFLCFKEEDVDKYLKIKVKKSISLVDYEIYDKYYEEFVRWGGFPEVVLEKNQENKEELLKDIFSSYFQNEIVNLADYRKNNKVRDLILLLATRVGSQLDLVKLSEELQITRVTLYSYLSFLQATYFIHLVSPFSKSIDREVSGMQKVYFCDNGILKIMSQIGSGHLFENAVFNQIKLLGPVNYYRKKSGLEVDFIFDKKIAYKVKLTASLVDLSRLKKRTQGLKIEKGLIVSKNYTNKIIKVLFGQFL